MSKIGFDNKADTYKPLIRVTEGGEFARLHASAPCVSVEAQFPISAKPKELPQRPSAAARSTHGMTGSVETQLSPFTLPWMN